MIARRAIAGSALVGLEDLADVPDVGALVVLAVGVQLHEHQHPVDAVAVLQPVRARLDRRADRVDERVQRPLRAEPTRLALVATVATPLPELATRWRHVGVRLGRDGSRLRLSVH